VCDLCGAVRDVAAGPIASEGGLETTSARAVAQVAPGFDVRSVERIFRGVCAACSKSRGRPKTS